MREARPDVSVVIAAYNAEGTLAEQLAAVARQDADFPFEVLVCDNGSTDGTAQLARSWVTRIPTLSVIDASARRGPGAARNIGVDHARADLLVFCDADDVIADDWLTQMRASLARAPFVASRIEHRRLNPQFPEELRAAEGMMYPTDPLPQFPMVGAGHMGVHTAAFRDVGGFDEEMRTAEDLDLSWRLQLAGYRLIGNPDAVVHVRHRPTLRGLYAQAYGYGSNHRRLHHKYALVFASHRPRSRQLPDESGAPAAEPDPSDAASQRHADGSVMRRVLSKAARIPRKAVKIVRSPLELGPLARRAGLTIGRLTSRNDPFGQQLDSDGRPRTGA